MFLIKRLKKLPIYDLFIRSMDGWQQWSRVSFIKNTLHHLGGRELSPSEQQLAKKEIRNANRK